MTSKITLEIEFEIGTLEEIGLGGFKAGWVDGEKDGRTYALTSGAGLGSELLEAHARDGERSVYARADVRVLAGQLFRELDKALDAGGGEQAE